MPGKIIGNFDTCSSCSLIRIEIPVIQVIALKSLQSGDFLWNNSKRKQRDNSGETVKEQRQNATFHARHAPAQSHSRTVLDGNK